MSESEQANSCDNRQLETPDQHERIPDMSHTTLYLRVFHVGVLTDDIFRRFEGNVLVAKSFQQQLQQRFGDEQSPQLKIVCNSDLEPAGRALLEKIGIEVVYTESKDAKRRSHLARLLLAENKKSSSKGQFSYADMLNSAAEDAQSSDTYPLFVSTDLARRFEQLIPQLEAMQAVVSAQWQRMETGNGQTIGQAAEVSMVGSLVEGVHDPQLVEAVLSGSEGITLQNLPKLFPNNALAVVDSGLRFSGITDNALAGKARVEESNVEVELGGNEDFLTAFEQMARAGKVCMLVIKPSMAGERQAEVSSNNDKYLRREVTYRQWALRTAKNSQVLRELMSRMQGETKDERLAAAVEELVDAHLFFVQVVDGNLEVVLTQRQREKGISLDRR